MLAAVSPLRAGLRRAVTVGSAVLDVFVLES